MLLNKWRKRGQTRFLFKDNREHDSREGGVSVKHDCMDAGGRATHGFEHGSSYFAEPMDGRERFS